MPSPELGAGPYASVAASAQNACIHVKETIMIVDRMMTIVAFFKFYTGFTWNYNVY